MVTLEEVSVDARERKVRVLFHATHGYQYIECIEGKVTVPKEEPPLEFYPKEDQRQMVLITCIAYAKVFGLDEKPKNLSISFH